MRISSVQRKTNETDISVELNLDGTGIHSNNTGIGFLDHMLDHLAVHGLFDLKTCAQGDLYIDMHHTVEDVALTLGTAFDQALGDRKGIFRMAHAYVPMDESLAFVAIDLSGRPYCIVEAKWSTGSIGTIPASLFRHFFESFAFASRSNVHARILYGQDDHHQIEALFKALARSLSAATRTDSRREGIIPSTKGSI
jgi:imidazoleglycerol-phosphate dehydratase